MPLRDRQMNALQQHDADMLQQVQYLVGVDEAGRGCLAGPVIAGACVLRPEFFQQAAAVRLSSAINDSKQLTAARRAEQLEVIEGLRSEGWLDFEVASSSVAEIAELNILGATRLAMRRAVEGLVGRARDWSLPLLVESGPLFEQVEAERVRLLVDGRPLKPFPYQHVGLVKGDGKSLAIAMASIVAKVRRDAEMARLAEQYPRYAFDQHKGYGTAVHRAALLLHGASPVHRELFLRKIL